VQLYRVNGKSLCTCWSQYRKLQVMFKVSPASLQTLDTRLTLTTSVIPNYKCVIMVSDWNCFKIFFRVFCTVNIRCRRFDHPVLIDFVVWQPSNAGFLKLYFPQLPRIQFKSSGTFMQRRRASSSRRFVDSMTIRLTLRLTSQTTSTTALWGPQIYQNRRTFCIRMYQVTNAICGYWLC
jgi:hypothetical protein